MLIQLTIVFIVLMVAKSLRRKGEMLVEGGEDEELVEFDEEADAEPTAAAVGLRRSFRRARGRIRHHVAGAESEYQIPWYLALGAAGSHAPAMWAGAGAGLPFGMPEDFNVGHEGCNWWFFDRGIVIDLGGNYVLRADGQGSDERGLRRFLGLLESHRPQRPLDGILVMVSCGELLDAARRGGEGLQQLEERADHVYRALWKVEKELDIQAPVYVLLTGADELSGFDGFCGALPEELGGEIFGWSSPYQRGTAYRQEWADEAFDVLRQRLELVQMEIFAQPTEIEGAGGVFSFPGAVEQLRAPVRLFLGQLFKPSAYHEELLLRGVYLCGEHLEARPEGDLRAHFGRTLFLRDLLEQKVFREKALATPAAKSLASRNRWVKAARIGLAAGLLLLGLGTYWAHTQLARNRGVFAEVLDESVKDLREVRRLRARDQRPDREQLTAHASHLIGGLTRVDTDRYGSLFLPASWPFVSDFDRRLRQALLRMFDEIIFEAMLRDLIHRTRVLTEPGPVAARAAPRLPPDWRARSADGWPSPVPIEATPQFQAWAAYRDELAALERHAEIFNSLKETGDLQDFGRVAEYVFSNPVPEGFFRKSSLYENALRDPHEAFEFSFHRQKATQKARDLARGFHLAVTERGDLLAILRLLDEQLRALAAEQLELQGESERLRLLVAAIDRARDALTRPEHEWVFRPHFAPGERYDRLIEALGGSRFIEPGTAEAVRRDGETEWIALRRQLAALTSELTGPLLELDDGKPLMQLSGDVQLLRTALDDFLGQNFMASAERRRPRPIPPGYHLVWDTPLLQQAARIYEPYERFRSRGLDFFSPDLRATLDTLARRRLGLNLSALVARAQGFEPEPAAIAPILLEEQLRSEIERFAAAVGPLEKVLAIYQELSLWPEHQELSRLVALQGLDLLQATDRILEEEKLYRPRFGDFSWWEGSAPAALAAFDVQDAAELAVYLELQRQRVHQLAVDYGQPLVTWLGKSGLHGQPAFRSLYTKWERILLELNDYEMKKPGNSVAALEEYVTRRLTETGVASCDKAVWQPAGGAREHDFFLARLVSLRRGLVTRCQALALRQEQTRYAGVKRFFDRRLTGKYPFAPAGVPDELAAEAAAADLKAFFEVFDRLVPPPPSPKKKEGEDAGEPQAKVPGAEPPPAPGSRLAATSDPVAQFLEEAKAVRAFFAAFLDAEAPEPAPVFDFDLEFRVNPAFEREGNQIIDWEIEIGQREGDYVRWDQRLTHRDAQPVGRWTPGRPLRLSLRWARDSPRIPVVLEPRRNVSVEGRTVRWEYRNHWSLVSLLQDLASEPEDFSDLSDPSPHTLRLVVATRPDATREGDAEPVPGPADDVLPTRVYLRLRVLAPETKAPLELPVFPVQAPRLEESLVALGAPDETRGRS